MVGAFEPASTVNNRARGATKGVRPRSFYVGDTLWETASELLHANRVPVSEFLRGALYDYICEQRPDLAQMIDPAEVNRQAARHAETAERRARESVRRATEYVHEQARAGTLPPAVHVPGDDIGPDEGGDADAPAVLEVPAAATPAASTRSLEAAVAAELARLRAEQQAGA